MAGLKEALMDDVSQPKGLPAKLRPAQVGASVQQARTEKPDIRDVERFANEWAKWWQEINPAWRKVSLPMSRSRDGPWVGLDLPGANGFLNVLICLKWWREQVETESKEWKEAVEDVTWVLRQMNGTPTPATAPMPTATAAPTPAAAAPTPAATAPMPNDTAPPATATTTAPASAVTVTAAATVPTPTTTPVAGIAPAGMPNTGTAAIATTVPTPTTTAGIAPAGMPTIGSLPSSDEHDTSTLGTDVEVDAKLARKQAKLEVQGLSPEKTEEFLMDIDADEEE